MRRLPIQNVSSYELTSRLARWNRFGVIFPYAEKSRDDPLIDAWHISTLCTSTRNEEIHTMNFPYLHDWHSSCRKLKLTLQYCCCCRRCRPTSPSHTQQLSSTFRLQCNISRRPAAARRRRQACECEAAGRNTTNTTSKNLL